MMFQSFNLVIATFLSWGMVLIIGVFLLINVKLVINNQLSPLALRRARSFTDKRSVSFSNSASSLYKSRGRALISTALIGRA